MILVVTRFVMVKLFVHGVDIKIHFLLLFIKKKLRLVGIWDDVYIGNCLDQELR